MFFEDVITGKNIEKSFGSFKLSVPELHIPKGFATALIGENGAGKTTLLNILTGLRLDAKGDITYFGKYDGVESDPYVKNSIGYVGSGYYYLPHWTTKQVEEITGLLFEDFDKEKFEKIAAALALDLKGKMGAPKKVSELSDGNKVKLMLCGALARKTGMLIMDEPASPLDPLMRDNLCDLIREYLSNGQGERSVFFSTHNVADMESVTDYVMIMEKGKIVEEGFVEDLKEKYVIVKGEKEFADSARKVLFSISESGYGFTGVCLSEKLDALAGMNISTERASLTDICVAVMKRYSGLSLTKDLEI
ncbi:MAG: ABC transporter ATP-binding protein [Lachnospiraceae bacterium]|jgi:ABC-2 type transport system ATP-binding protein|nr:ABC transporter ATP-binding protein [Lachnospiraceae bacterium]